MRSSKFRQAEVFRFLPQVEKINQKISNKKSQIEKRRKRKNTNSKINRRKTFTSKSSEKAELKKFTYNLRLKIFDLRLKIFDLRIYEKEKFAKELTKEVWMRWKRSLFMHM